MSTNAKRRAGRRTRIAARKARTDRPKLSNKRATRAPAHSGQVDAAAAPPADQPNRLFVTQQETESKAAALARTALRPAVQAGLTLRCYSSVELGELSITDLIDNLGKQCEAAGNGDQRRIEGMLLSQAHSLDAIFNTLARRAAQNIGEYIEACQTYLRLALKAQTQCRATLETLALIKNPRQVAFVRQANIATGPQQVNNGVEPSPLTSRAREIETTPSKLLEEQHAERLECGATSATGSADSAMAAVAAVDRAEDGPR